MARIIIENLFGRELQADDHSKTLLRHFQDHGIDWMHACGGKGRCTTCKVVIRAGGKNLQPLSAAETRYFREGALKDNERLACQTKIAEDIVVFVPEEYQLPHMNYSIVPPEQ